MPELPAENVDNQQVIRPARPVTYYDWLKAGFFTSLGVALLALLALSVWRLAVAALGISVPFVVGTVLALLLEPVVARLERRGLKRVAAVGVVFGVFLLVLVLLGLLAIPALISQAGQLAQNGPEYVEKVRTFTNDFLAHHRRIGSVTLPANFDALSAQLSQKISDAVRNSAGSLTGFLLGSVGTLLEIIITLIVAFYLLLDIDRLRARLFYLVPEKARQPMHLFGGDIGGVFSDYLRGLLIVCASYGTVAALLFLGLGFAHPEMRRYGLLMGALAGVLYAVPYLGALATALVAFLVAFAAGGAAFGGIVVGLVLLLNQIFDNIVLPRVVGSGVGLHPVATVFALALGGALFGLPGLLLSVPIAASVQVVLFRLFPKLTTPTPPAFLRTQGVPPAEGQSAKILEGAEAAKDKA